VFDPFATAATVRALENLNRFARSLGRHAPDQTHHGHCGKQQFASACISDSVSHGELSLKVMGSSCAALSVSKLS
jgi:hypothetical protein